MEYKATRGGKPRNKFEILNGQLVHAIRTDGPLLRQRSLCSEEPRINGWNVLPEDSTITCQKCIEMMDKKIGFRPKTNRFRLKTHFIGCPCGRVRTIEPTVTEDESLVTCQKCLISIEYEKETSGRLNRKMYDKGDHAELLFKNKIYQRKLAKESGTSNQRHKTKKQPLAHLRRLRNYPEKVVADRLSKNIPSIPNMHKHHWSYNRDDAMDIIWLNPKDHAKIHLYMKYDKVNFKYIRYDTMELMDTKEKHQQYIDYILSLDNDQLLKLDLLCR